MKKFELHRQLFHILFGGALLALAVVLGEERTRLFYAGGFLSGVLIFHLKLSGIRLPVVDGVLSRFERKDALFPGQGAILYFAGALLAFSFLPFNFALATVAIVAFGDGFATIVGMSGKHVLPWNRKKTWEGFLAFVFSAAAMASLALTVPTSLFYALSLGLAETADLRTDDNLLLPSVAVFLFHVMGRVGG